MTINLARGGLCPWAKDAPATIEFCERRLCDWIVEPSNAWSNVAFLAAGLYVLVRERHEPRSALPAVGVSAILVGIGSFLFHATATRWGELLDVSAMYLISGLFVAFNVRRAFGISNARLIALYVALVVASSSWMVLSGKSGIGIFSLQLGIAAVLEVRIFRQELEVGTRYRFLFALLAAFATSFVIWVLDVTGKLCDPDNHLLTGHAVWHVLNGFSLVFFYRFHRETGKRSSSIAILPT